MSNQLLTSPIYGSDRCVSSTVAVAFESEIFVGVVEEATQGLGLTPLLRVLFFTPDWRCSRVCNCGQCSN